MNTLAAQQEALLDALLAWPADTASNNIANYADGDYLRGLSAYQANGHGLAEQSMRTVFPVLAQLLGDESIRSLARAFWHAKPPHRGDLAQWGRELATFIANSTQLASEPYLADVVAIEWSLHESAGLAHQTLDTASFALLMQQDPHELHMHLAPGCTVMVSRWPVVSILHAHQDRDPQHAPHLHHIAHRLHTNVAETAITWRANLRPRVREADIGEAPFIQSLLAGMPLGQALDNAPLLDFNTWLPMAVQTHLLLGIQHTPP